MNKIRYIEELVKEWPNVTRVISSLKNLSIVASNGCMYDIVDEYTLFSPNRRIKGNIDDTDISSLKECLQDWRSYLASECLTKEVKSLVR